MLRDLFKHFSRSLRTVVAQHLRIQLRLVFIYLYCVVCENVSSTWTLSNLSTLLTLRIFVDAINQRFQSMSRLDYV